jgi:hypothetical protein
MFGKLKKHVVLKKRRGDNLFWLRLLAGEPSNEIKANWVSI